MKAANARFDMAKALTPALCHWAAVAACVWLFVPSAARADLGYEEQRTQAVLDREGLTAEASPEGKRIAHVRVVQDDVFIRGELLDFVTFFNAFHWLTDPRIVTQELLFREGERYRTERIEETMRNLRSLGIFSFVRIVPVHTENPNEVEVLVHTRDLWSLRIEQSFQITGSNIDYLRMQLIERNFFGYQKAATLRFGLTPDTFRVGQLYLDRRVAGSRFYLSESFDLIFNRGVIPKSPDHGGDLEGFAATASLRRPFYTLADRFSVTLDGTFSTRIARVLRNGRPLVYDDPGTMDPESIPLVWDERRATGILQGLYRIGTAVKQTFGGGLRYEERYVTPNAETALPTANEAAFRRDVLPRSRRDIGPSVQYTLNTPTFATFEDLGTFGTSENVQTGPRFETVLWLPLAGMGSTTTAAVMRAEAGYVLAQGDGLLEVAASVSGRVERGGLYDQHVRAEVRGATPRFGPLRLVGRFVYEGRRRDTQRTLVSLGGDNGLRGFVSQAFAAIGGNLVRGNVELRTAALDIASVHIGGVLFYDVGAVYTDASAITLHHTLGIGIRLLFPQFNRYPFRFDGGVPLSEGTPTFAPSFGGLQAVPLTATEDLLGAEE